MAWTWNEGDIVELTFQGRLYNQLIMTVLHYRLKTAATPDGETASQSFKDAITDPGGVWAKYIACLSHDWSAELVAVQRVHVVRQRRYEYPMVAAGGQAGDAGTANVQASIEKWTELATPRHDKKGEGQVGRIAIPAVPQNRYLGGNLLDLYRTGEMKNLADILSTTITDGVANVWVPIIWHRKGTTKTFDDIKGCTVKATVRTEYRRTVGVGK